MRSRPTRRLGSRAHLFSCRAQCAAGGVTLILRGELDVTGAAETRRTLLSLEPPYGGWLVIDLRGLSFMDSTGVRLILQAMGFAERHGATLAVIKGPEAVHRVLEIVGLAEQLLVVDETRSPSRIDQEA